MANVRVHVEVNNSTFHLAKKRITPLFLPFGFVGSQ
jgi:hypothetical protein